jgi:hypothetical protein
MGKELKRSSQESAKASKGMEVEERPGFEDEGDLMLRCA